MIVLHFFSDAKPYFVALYLHGNDNKDKLNCAKVSFMSMGQLQFSGFPALPCLLRVSHSNSGATPQHVQPI